MNFKKRLLYYLSGFTIGLLLVFSILGIRGCEWLPKTRIINAINSSQLYISIADLENIKCNQATNAVFNLLSNGEIDFSKSETQNKLKKYFIKSDKLSAVVEINFSDSTSKIQNIKGLPKCTTVKNNSFMPFYRTNEMMLSILKKLPTKFENSYNCSLNHYKLDSTFSNKILSKGTIIFNHSLPKRKPNPLFIAELKIDSSVFYVLIQQGEKRIRFKKLIKNNNVSKDFLNSFLFSKNETLPCN